MKKRKQLEKLAAIVQVVSVCQLREGEKRNKLEKVFCAPSSPLKW
jgi:hypothetical protein